MSLPFTTAQFLEVFARYNEAVWPAQWALNGLALLALAMALRGGAAASRMASAILALLWAWMALAYHVAFFRAVNPAALAFAAAFLLAAALFVWHGVLHGALAFERPRSRARLALVAGMALTALALYPAIGLAAGHRYPAFATFGLPCPTTIFTLALLLSAARRAPLPVFVVPVAWSFVGAAAALRLGMHEDLLLAAIGVAAAVALVVRSPADGDEGHPGRDGARRGDAVAAQPRD